jgi:hypothetical protein
MRARAIREIKFELATAVLVAGLILSLIGVKGTYFAEPHIPVIDDLAHDLGAWNTWLSIIGPLLLLVGIWVVGDGILKRREFDRLIETTSKAAFVRNQDRLEELAWLLSEEHELRVFEKKQEFRIK